MNENDTANPGGQNVNEPGFSWMRFFSVLYQWRKFIVLNVLLLSLLAVIVSLILPKWYKASAAVLPPKQPGLLGALGGASSLLRGISGFSGLGSLGKQDEYNHFAILNSRTAMEMVINKFDLINVYETSDSSLEKTIKALRKNASFELEPEDYYTIEVFDRDPQRAADMANYFIDVLNTISIEIGTKEARSNREFLGNRLAETKRELREAEDSLKIFQEKTGFLIIPSENAAGITAIAELYAMREEKAIQMAILERSTGKENVLLKQMRLEVEEIDKKLSTIPESGLEAFRYFREVAVFQKILEFLVPLYEQAKVEEHRDVPVILVLDEAVPPERKELPKRTLIVLSVAFLSMLLNLMIIFLMEGVLRKGPSPGVFEEKAYRITQKILSFYRIRLEERRL